MRGVITETKNGRAVLLTRGGGFVNIKDKNYSVGDKVNITPHTGRICAMAAGFAAICVGLGSYFTPAGYLSVDINPSLMMTVNVYDRVIDVKSLNDDARVLLDKADIKGKSAKNSLEMLIKASEEIGYINENNREVILEVVPRITRPRVKNLRYDSVNITKEVSDMDTFRVAEDMGVSVAKAKAIEEYTAKKGGDMRSNAVKFNDKSVKEIQTILRDDSDNKTTDTQPVQKVTEVRPTTLAQQSGAKRGYTTTQNTPVGSAAVEAPGVTENTAPAPMPVPEEHIPPVIAAEKDTQAAQPQRDNAPEVKPLPVREDTPQSEFQPIIGADTEIPPADTEEPAKPQVNRSHGGSSSPRVPADSSFVEKEEQKPQDGIQDQDTAIVPDNPPKTDETVTDAAKAADNQPPKENPAENEREPEPSVPVSPNHGQNGQDSDPPPQPAPKPEEPSQEGGERPHEPPHENNAPHDEPPAPQNADNGRSE